VKTITFRLVPAKAFSVRETFDEKPPYQPYRGQYALDRKVVFNLLRTATHYSNPQ